MLAGKIATLLIIATVLSLISALIVLVADIALVYLGVKLFQRLRQGLILLQ